MSKISKKEVAEIAADLKRRRFWRAAKFFRTLQDTEPSDIGEVAQLIGISQRQAFYLAKIHRVFSELGVAGDRLEAIGWTKLKVVVDYINSANCEALLEMAQFCSIRQLKFLLRNEPPVLGERCVVFYMSPAQYVAFEEAMLAHGAVKIGRGLVGKEQALTRFIKTAAQSKQQNGKSQQ